MKYLVRDCDPNTGEPDDDGYDDEYVVRYNGSSTKFNPTNNWGVFKLVVLPSCPLLCFSWRTWRWRLRTTFRKFWNQTLERRGKKWEMSLRRRRHSPWHLCEHLMVCINKLSLLAWITNLLTEIKWIQVLIHCAVFSVYWCNVSSHTEAVGNIISFLGMQPCERSDKVPENKNSHVLFLAGEFKIKLFWIVEDVSHPAHRNRSTPHSPAQVVWISQQITDSPSVLRCVSRRSWCPGARPPGAGWRRHHAGDGSQQWWECCWCNPGFCRLKL